MAGAVTQGRAELEKLEKEFKERGPSANGARSWTMGILGNVLVNQNKPLEAEPLLADVYRLDPRAGSSYSVVLILNGKYPLAEEVARASVRRIKEDLAKAIQQEAREVHRSQGIAVPDTEAKP